MGYILGICWSVLRYYQMSVVYKQRVTHNNFILWSYKTNSATVNVTQWENRFELYVREIWSAKFLVIIQIYSPIIPWRRSAEWNSVPEYRTVWKAQLLYDSCNSHQYQARCLVGPRQWSKYAFQTLKTMLRLFHTMSLVTIYRPKTQRNSIIPSFLLVLHVEIFQYLCRLKFCIQPYSDTVRSCTLFDRSGHMNDGKTKIIMFNYAS